MSSSSWYLEQNASTGTAFSPTKPLNSLAGLVLQNTLQKSNRWGFSDRKQAISQVLKVEVRLLTLIWINLLIKSTDVLARGRPVGHWSVNLFRHRLLCTVIECWDVAGGRRAVEDDCYLERSIRVVWAHHSGHVYLPAWTALPQGGWEGAIYLFICLFGFFFFFKRKGAALHSQNERVVRTERRWREDVEMHTDAVFSPF